MRLLLDTHVLLWALSGSKRLPDDARELIESADNEVLFSAASIWEIAIKAQLLRAEFGVDVETIAAAARDTDFDELAISSRHAAGVAALPLHHKDPFDRMLMSQAIVEPARLVTADRALAAYSSDLVMLVESSR
jgi:PIN domain nuclease of toxin-antitoxin system